MAEAALKDDGAPEPGKGAAAKGGSAKAAAAKDAGRAWPDQESMDAGTLAKPLAESRWSLREFPDPGHRIVLERGTPYEAVFQPSFWANIVKRAKMQPGQSIRLLNDEMTVFADLIVLDVGTNWAVVGEYYKRSGDELLKSRPPSAAASRYRVEFNGPLDKWRVLRDDNQVVKAGFENKVQADQFMADHQRRLGQ